MTNVRSTLAEIWKELRQASIIDDLAIIEYIAALLIEMSNRPWPFGEQQRPKKPRIRYNVDDKHIKNLLSRAIAAMPTQLLIEDNKIARFFNQYVLFFPDDYRERDSYPTPRHIVDFMLNILQVSPQHTFADFACGSAGFLVQREKKGYPTKSPDIGMDISEEWTRIARANMFLHQSKEIDIRAANSLRVFGFQSQFAAQKFDRIAISPPLNEIIEVDQQSGTLSWLEDYHQKQLSDAAFTSLLLRQLNANGKGAIIVSSKLLELSSSLSKYYALLNKELIEKNRLRAIITLKNGLHAQSEPVHILSLTQNKNVRTQANVVWLCHAEKDGYKDQKRDLMEESSQSVEQNDLPLLQMVVQLNVNNQQKSTENAGIWNKTLVMNNIYYGIVLKPFPGGTIAAIEYDNVTTLCVEITRDSIQRNERIYLNCQTGKLSSAKKFQAAKKKRIFVRGNEEQMVAISVDGRVLGITKNHEYISAKKYELLPSSYFEEHDPYSKLNKRAAAPEPLETFHESYRTPLRSAPREDLSITQQEEYPTKPPIKKTLPKVATQSTTLLQLLNAKQRIVWRTIEKEYTSDNYALYFTIKELQNTLIGQKQHVDTLSTIELLEHLGLIRKVFLQTENGTIQAYRRIIVKEVIEATRSVRQSEKK